MNNQGQTSSVAAVIIFFILLFIFAKWGPSIPFSVLSQAKGEPMVVTGEGKSTVIPDIAKVSAGIQESGQVLSQAQDSANKKSQSLVTALKNLGVAEKDIKTSSYNIYPQQNYQANPPTITGYQVSINYEVTVRRIDQINQILTTVTGSGANLVGGVNFDLSDNAKNKAMDAARQDAVAQAKTNAQSLAKAAGVTLGRIINISENQNANPRPVPMADRAVSMSAGTPVQPNIQPGIAEIDLMVSLSYEIR